MALQKTITKSDMTTGNYIRLVAVQLPYYDYDKGVTPGRLAFNVYVDEDAAKIKHADPCNTFNLDLPHIKDLDLSNWNSISRSIYESKRNFAELADSADC